MNYDLYAFNEHVTNSCEYLFNTLGFPNVVVELGVFKGFFTFSMLHTIVPKIPNYKHIAIDPYTTSPDLESKVIEEARISFLKNVDVCPYKNNLEFIQKTSRDGLMTLLNRGEQAQLVYVDGDHMASTVLQDLVLSFDLLKPGGVLLCDDSVTWGNDKSIGETPRLAVNSFINCYWKKIQILPIPNSYQTAILKL
jgi:predicted O-methyltransferase YrrM